MTIAEAKGLFEEDLKDGKCSDDCPECNAKELAIQAMEFMESVVRCKDCRHRKTPRCGFWFDDNESKIQESWDYPTGYCSYGERKDGVDG